MASETSGERYIALLSDQRAAIRREIASCFPPGFDSPENIKRIMAAAATPPAKTRRQGYDARSWRVSKTERNQRVAKLLAEGITIEQVAERENLTLDYAIELAKRLGLKYDTNWRAEQRRIHASIAEAVARGMTAGELAAKLGWSEKRVSHYVAKARRKLKEATNG
jgi:DNA-binding NarL/FixJ family response regulator